MRAAAVMLSALLLGACETAGSGSSAGTDWRGALGVLTGEVVQGAAAVACMDAIHEGAAAGVSGEATLRRCSAQAQQEICRAAQTRMRWMARRVGYEKRQEDQVCDADAWGGPFCRAQRAEVWETKAQQKQARRWAEASCRVAGVVQ